MVKIEKIVWNRLISSKSYNRHRGS